MTDDRGIDELVQEIFKRPANDEIAEMLEDPQAYLLRLAESVSKERQADECPSLA